MAPRADLWQALNEMTLKLGCHEKRLLLDGYKIATEAYAHAVRELQTKMGTTDRSAYEESRKIAEDARFQSERVRCELEDHVLDHGC